MEITVPWFVVSLVRNPYDSKRFKAVRIFLVPLLSAPQGLLQNPDSLTMINPRFGISNIVFPEF